jgi:uncharacterized membrane protein YphA (DoxX/SURF4 family)
MFSDFEKLSVRKITLLGPGHLMFAMAAASFAILSLVYGDFAPLWDAVSMAIVAREWLLCGTSLILLVASAGLLFATTAAASLLAIGLYYLVWGLLSTRPILSHPLDAGSWYGFCEAATSLAGAWVLLTLVRGTEPRLARIAQVIFGLTCVFYGWSHFAYLKYTATFVPGWLPGHTEFAGLTGVCHMAAGIALLVGILPRLAATLEATMMSLFGLLVWVPSFFSLPRPPWAGTVRNQWSELAANLLLAGCAWIIAESLRSYPWGLRAGAASPSPFASSAP